MFYPVCTIIGIQQKFSFGNNIVYQEKVNQTYVEINLQRKIANFITTEMLMGLLNDKVALTLSSGLGQQ